MRVLLDTQLLLWALAQERKLPKSARQLIETSDVFVSAASLWEVAIKSSLGKLNFGPERVRAAIQPSGFEELAITGTHAVAAAGLPWHHRDPFDRMLIAQSAVEPMILLTADKALAPYGELVRVVV